MTALSPWTGRPLPGNSSLAAAKQVQAAATKSSSATAMTSILRREAAFRWMMPLLSSITPTYIEQTLRGAFAGSHVQAWQLFDLMEDTWPRLSKNLNEIKRAVVSLDWSLDAYCEDEETPSDSAIERKRLVEAAVRGMMPDPAGDEAGFESTIYDILDAWGKGISICEILWHQRPAGDLGDITAPKATAWVRPDAYAWAGDNRLGLNPNSLESYANPNKARGYLVTPAYYAAPEDIIPFPEDKFLIAVCKAKTGHPLSSGLLRSLAWWWCASNFSADWLMNLAQIFGLPFRWATYASGTPQVTVNAISAVLEDMGSNAWAAFPEGVTMELKEAEMGKGQSPQSDLLDRADKNCDLLILGQTLTSDVGTQGSGSMALGRVHQGVKEDNVKAAACFVADVLNNQLIPMILRQNYGDQEEAPAFCPEPNSPDDLTTDATRFVALLNAGVPLPKKWFYEKQEIPMPQEGEETISKSDLATQASPRTPTEDNPKAMYDETRPERNGQAFSATFQPKPVPQIKINRLARAFAEDLAPFRSRLERILTIADPEILRARLQQLSNEIPSLLKDINADPESARVLEDEMSAGVLQVIKSRTNHANARS